MENKWCKPQLEKTETDLTAAETRCDNERNCEMFYDVNSANKAFVMCGKTSVIRTSEFLGSSVYVKCIFNSFEYINFRT